ncbi:hypothetical protein SEA_REDWATTLEHOG_115 [Gordonia phage RedWattleHog]|uniref:Uncharacterized protein n=1 Tax=Gordonia phage Stormageddon TaxID=2656541 RepID=A0A649VS02_9CAUD|nr:hypothetical protein KHQ86_gp186 [Gordonia phage Stormageddon]QGJ94974.1 hypothetical protein SEA_STORMAGEDDON_114 [Gordonia phage Stormageddon]QLF83618.1 hypothetical protein SEA_REDWATTLEHOG_115 [Gordonia phage RedWattleHog]
MRRTLSRVREYFGFTSAREQAAATYGRHAAGPFTPPFHAVWGYGPVNPFSGGRHRPENIPWWAGILSDDEVRPSAVSQLAAS